jgi:hypothetical protein
LLVKTPREARLLCSITLGSSFQQFPGTIIQTP